MIAQSVEFVIINTVNFEIGRCIYEKISVKESGFEGILYQGNGCKNKVMIVLSGSNGGMKLTAKCAEFYHKKEY